MTEGAPTTVRRGFTTTHWAVLATTALAIGAAAASLACQAPPEPRGTVIVSFAGVLDHRCPVPGVFCNVVNFTTPGSPREYRSVDLTMLFNASCGADCSYEIESDVADSGPTCHCPWGSSGLLNWSPTWSGVLPSGPGWILIAENGFCPTGGCIPFPLGAVITLYDEGPSTGPAT